MCTNGEILEANYASRDCGKGTWSSITKYAANECLGFGRHTFYNTSNYCPRDGPSLAPVDPLTTPKPTAKDPAAAVVTSPAPAAAGNDTNSTDSGGSGSSMMMLTTDFVNSMVQKHDSYLGDNCGGGDPDNLNWEFPSAVFFVITIVTTIGYGTFAPTTSAGKAFTVIFAFVGIAYFGMVVGLVGHQVVLAIQNTAKCCCHRKKKGYKLNGKKTLLWTILMMVVYIVIIGMGAHAAADWDVGDGMYCKFVFSFFPPSHLSFLFLLSLSPLLSLSSLSSVSLVSPAISLAISPTKSRIALVFFF
jgi:hypothetical protein